MWDDIACCSTIIMEVTKQVNVGGAGIKALLPVINFSV